MLDGVKTATAGLWKHEYEPHGEHVEHAGERQILLDSNNEPLAVVEITRVEQYRFDEVPWEFADREGEGFRSIQHWREGHRSYYQRDGITVGDDDLVVCVWMRVVKRPAGDPPPRTRT